MGTQAAWSTRTSQLAKVTPKVKASSFLSSHPATDISSSLWLGETEAENPSEDKKQRPLDSADPSSNLSTPQAYFKCLLCAWMMGELGLQE